MNPACLVMSSLCSVLLWVFLQSNISWWMPEKSIIDDMLFTIHEYDSNLCSNEHCFSSSENKTWKKIQAYVRVEPMMSKIL